MDIILSTVVFMVLIYLVWKEFFAVKSDLFGEQFKKLTEERDRLMEDGVRYQSDLVQKIEKIAELTNDLSKEKAEKNEFLGQNKRMFIENENYKNDAKNLHVKIQEQEKLISEYKAEQKRRDREYEIKIEKLEHAREKFEKEQMRIIREDEDKIQKTYEEQNRIWNDHENVVLSKLREICQKPSINFSFYDNVNLPDGFDAKIKPDFLVEFLSQFIIFDAKCSKQKNPQSFFADQVKKTAEKYKNQEKIYPTVFFVVSQNEIIGLKQLSYIEKGYSFYIITQEALEPILANFKKISDYEKLENFDPQDRETIVNLIANYDRHISFQNAANILLTKESVSLMKGKDNLPADFFEEINIRKQNMRPIRFKDADIKRITHNLFEQEKEISKLTMPKVAITTSDMLEAQNGLFYNKL